MGQAGEACGQKPLGDEDMKAYDRGTGLWNEVYSQYRPADLRNIFLTVEPGFDCCLKEFGKNTHRVLDFGCGTGDILFQYIQYFPEKKSVGIDEAEKGIVFAEETARLSGYRKVHFFTGNSKMLEDFDDGEFDGIILSNVLDVMSGPADEVILQRLDRVLVPGGRWFIKLNPYYTEKELRELDYERENNNLYEEGGILRLHQETTCHWKKVFETYGTIERYMEFVYPWQEGLNRLFIVKKRDSMVNSKCKDKNTT